MNTKMKVLIAYDGLGSTDKMIHDLKRAGLPQKIEAIILTIADAFVLPNSNDLGTPLSKSADDYLKKSRALAVLRVKKQVDEARRTAQQGAYYFRKAFPSWTVKAESFADSPAWGIVKKAGEWNADLVVVESHNKLGVAKFLMGSVAQKVITEAPCSVRIINPGVEEADSPARIVVGVDGSENGQLVVEAICRRLWKKGSSIHLITAVDSTIDRKKYSWMQKVLENFRNKLRSNGLIVSNFIKKEDPKPLLVKDAEEWGADCIFVGARGLNIVERFLIGSVSFAVATKAKCTVEIIRAKVWKK